MSPISSSRTQSTLLLALAIGAAVILSQPSASQNLAEPIAPQLPSPPPAAAAPQVDIPTASKLVASQAGQSPQPTTSQPSGGPATTINPTIAPHSDGTSALASPRPASSPPPLSGMPPSGRVADSPGDRSVASEKASPDATTAVRPAGQRLRSGDTLKISFFEMLDIPRDTNSSDGNVLVESSDPAGARKAPDKMDILRTFYQRIDLTGEYVIEADGMIVLPRLGPIRAEGLTTSELREVALAAFQKVMSQPGDVNIAILKRQPIYVVGLTQSSGSFQMVPDMMVLHAVALAGGLKREALEAYRVSQYVTETSKLKQARDLLGRLLARRAALTAAYNGDADTDVTPPTQLVALVGELEAAMLQSQERRRALHAISISNNERNALVELAEHLQNRVKMLGKRKSEITNESEKRRERLDEMNALMKRGVINSQRSEVTETNYFQILSRRDDIQSEEQKTIFDLAQAEAAIKKFDIQLRATRLEKLAALDAEISIASNQVASTEMVAGVLRKLDERSKFAMSDVIYKIIRRSNGGATVITADETTLLQPGDVLRVSLRETRPAETSAVEANPGLDRTIR